MIITDYLILIPGKSLLVLGMTNIQIKNHLQLIECINFQ